MKITEYNETKIQVALDCIIFGFDQEQLKLLLIKRDFEPEKGKWSLMGGFLKAKESLDEAAVRVLHSLTGLSHVYMEQLSAFGGVNRDPVERTVSIAYYALINIQEHNHELSNDFGAKWFDVEDLPHLIFDHMDMVQEAISRLRYKASVKPVGFELLPEKFTMRQLQKLYEAIHGRKIDKRNFVKKINSMDLLIKQNEKDKNSSKKGSFLYKFDKSKYNRKSENGFTFGI
ncbi:MAG: NUDIX domain-containing protein [Cyclobacteriaceae bacterium]